MIIDWIVQARKLKNVKRCGTMNLVSRESIAEHSYYVSVLALDIAKRLESQDKKVKIDYGKLLQKAMFHDIEEGIIGDIPHPFKHSSELINKVIEGHKNLVVRRFFPKWVALWNETAKDGLEGEIVQMADFIELYMFCAEEKILGNRDLYVSEIMNTCVSILDNRVFRGISREYFKEIKVYCTRGGLLNEHNETVKGTKRSEESSI